MKTLCDSCRGECCQTLVLPLSASADIDVDWMLTRGTLTQGPGNVMLWRIRSRCQHLTRAGRCAIYATRPETCRRYPPGGEACMQARARKGLA